MSKSQQLPFKMIPLPDDIQKRIASDFRGFPNGLVSCNHWGYKVSATTTEQELDGIFNYPLDPRDVWLVTPPKCGTTWSQEMVWLIANDLDYEGAKSPLMPDRWNFPDFVTVIDKDDMPRWFRGPTDDFSALTGDPHRPAPRYVKCHLPLSMYRPQLLETCRVVYVARNPKDLCVSLYHHSRFFYCYDFEGDFELFLQYFMDGNITDLPCVEHMIEAWNLRPHPNLCFLFYEDMKRDLKSQIRKVAKFLGKDFSEEQVTKLAEHLHIDNFKKNPYVNRENLKQDGVAYTDRTDFIRKGKTGDWKGAFTAEMNDKFDRWLEDKLKGTDLRFTMELDTQD
ncbi:Sulfotransferase 1C2 [Amphibalanus amphitrite]|uniref:Sulfotransferase 1C2 n=3 Tax=Amphibalanus amphitrite TaxID=1232801 RepID=A0A6A4X5M9_AMPAM|nr:Sulfotransferase 1C2 [Amphibalanus amphitrite]